MFACREFSCLQRDWTLDRFTSPTVSVDRSQISTRVYQLQPPGPRSLQLDRQNHPQSPSRDREGTLSEFRQNGPVIQNASRSFFASIFLKSSPGTFRRSSIALRFPLSDR